MTPLLAAAASAPSVTARDLLGGRTALTVIAPHPDDETLGCGALLHEAAAQGVACNVICVTDGSRSHPNSPTWGASRLARARAAEIRSAVALLAPGASVDHLGHPDCATPHVGPAAEICVARLDALTPRHALVLAPWGADPHADHERTAALVRRLAAGRPDVALLSYPIWGRFADAIPPGWIRTLRPSGAARSAKRAALACHRTQMTRLIADDPDGFVMCQANQAHFLDHPEIFLAD